MQYACNGFFSNLVFSSLSSQSPRTFSFTCMQPSTLCPYYRNWLLHFWNDNFRHPTLLPQLCTFPAFLSISTNKLFFRVSKLQAILSSIFINPLKVSFNYPDCFAAPKRLLTISSISFSYCLSVYPPDKTRKSSICQTILLLPILSNCH